MQFRIRFSVLAMRSSVTLCAALLLAACPGTKLRPTLPPDVWVDTYDQQSASKVDVLWVVDNSGSMQPHQENLAKNFQEFIDLFSKGAIDFRIAVTTTDIFYDQGQLKGSPKVLSPATPNLATAFAANIRVGTSGSPYEAGLQAAQMAIERQAQDNAPKLQAIEQCKTACKGDLNCIDGCPGQYPVEFLRPGAYVYLIFVTDEQDRSDQTVRYYWRAFETAMGVGNDGTVTTAAIIGLEGDACDATFGSRYLELSNLTGGEVGSICDTSFAKTLRKLATSAVGLKRKFALSRTPNVETLKVAVRYPCNSPDEVFKACAEVNKDECQGQPAEAVAAVCTPPQGGPDGWSYEPESQVIYFAGESVPGLHSSIEIQYYEEGTQP